MSAPPPDPHPEDRPVDPYVPPPPSSGWEPGPAATPGPARPPAAMSPSEERNWAMAAHLSALITFVGIPSLFGPLLVWLVKRDASGFVDEHGKEALNFNLSVTLYAIVGVVVGVLVAIVTLGLGVLLIVPLGFAAAIAWLVFVILAAVKASNGEGYRYPVTIRFVK